MRHSADGGCRTRQRTAAQGVAIRTGSESSGPTGRKAYGLRGRLLLPGVSSG